MANPAGESGAAPLRLDFDRRLKLAFHGSRITTDAGLLAYRARDGQTLVADLVAGKAGEDWGQDRRPRSLCHVPDGRGRGAKRPVWGNSAADRATPAAASSSLRRSLMSMPRTDNGRTAPCKPESAPSMGKNGRVHGGSQQMQANVVPQHAQNCQGRPERLQCC